MHRVTLIPERDRQATAPENGPHRQVACQDAGLQLRETVLPSDSNEVPHENAGNAEPLIGRNLYGAFGVK